MRSLLPIPFFLVLVSLSLCAQTEPKFLLGIVSISATEANNQRFIQAATKGAAAKGWETSVIDAQGSAVQANSAIQNLVQRKAGAIIDMVFPVSSLGAGLHAAKRGFDSSGDLGWWPR